MQQITNAKGVQKPIFTNLENLCVSVQRIKTFGTIALETWNYVAHHSVGKRYSMVNGKFTDVHYSDLCAACSPLCCFDGYFLEGCKFKSTLQFYQFLILVFFSGLCLMCMILQGVGAHRLCFYLLPSGYIRPTEKSVFVMYQIKTFHPSLHSFY